MFYFSKRSESRLETIHPDLQTILRTVIQDYDFSILCGYRGEREQNHLFNTGKSLLRFPKSNHNTKPSRAVDVAPYPIDWEDLNRFHELAGRILEVANLLNIGLTWGGHWKTFPDYSHFELEV